MSKFRNSNFELIHANFRVSPWPKKCLFRLKKITKNLIKVTFYHISISIIQGSGINSKWDQFKVGSIHKTRICLQLNQFSLKYLQKMVFNILGLSISLTNFGLTQAGYYDLTQKIKSSLENNTNYNTNSEFRREFGFRNLADDDDLLSNLANYGCWCMPLAGNYGKGPPVDEFDVLCKALHDGYQCAVQDAQLRGEVCVPNEVRYFDSYDGRDIDEIRSDCEAANVDACAQDACKVENWFKAKYILLDFI